jgi:hypothetical protein
MCVVPRKCGLEQGRKRRRAREWVVGGGAVEVQGSRGGRGVVVTKRERW